MKTIIEMSGDEIQRRIPYAFICETRDGAVWSTGTRRRKWNKLIDDASQRRFARLFKLAREWYLIKGVPDKYRMRISELTDWDTLASFCYNL